MTSDVRDEIEERLAAAEPEVEVIMVEQPARDAVRVFIDHPDGVDLGLCERVTRSLQDMLASYSLEVSSPGVDRPLTKPAHFVRFIGRRVRVRTTEQIDGRRNFTGQLTAADERAVRVDPGDGAVEIPHADIRRSNLIGEGGS